MNMTFNYKENRYRNIGLKVEMILDFWKGQHNGVTGNGQAHTQYLKRHQNDNVVIKLILHQEGISVAISGKSLVFDYQMEGYANINLQFFIEFDINIILYSYYERFNFEFTELMR